MNTLNATTNATGSTTYRIVGAVAAGAAALLAVEWLSLGSVARVLLVTAVAGIGSLVGYVVGMERARRRGDREGVS